MKSSPATALEMVEAKLAFELQIVVLDPPARLGGGDELLEGAVLRQRREPVMGRLDLALGPLDEQPLLCAGPITVRSAHPHAGEARAPGKGSAFPPRDLTKALRREALSQFQYRKRWVGRIPRESRGGPAATPRR